MKKNKITILKELKQFLTLKAEYYGVLETDYKTEIKSSNSKVKTNKNN